MERMRLVVGRKHLPHCEQSHHHSLWDQTLRFVLHPCSRGTTGMGILGGSWCATAAQTLTLYQQEARPLYSSL